jgi:hypothetical protein
MPGRPDFSQPGTDGGGQTVATNQRPNLKTVELDSDTEVAAAASELTEVYAPNGAIWSVVGAKIKVDPDSDATTGIHEFRIRPAGGKMSFLLGRSNYDTLLEFNYLNWNSADTISLPAGGAAQGQAIRQLRASEDKPIKIRYKNDTDATQENSRTINLLVEESTL